MCLSKIDGPRGWMYCVAPLAKTLWASCSDRKIRIYGINPQKEVTY